MRLLKKLPTKSLASSILLPLCLLVTGCSGGQGGVGTNSGSLFNDSTATGISGVQLTGLWEYTLIQHADEEFVEITADNQVIEWKFDDNFSRNCYEKDGPYQLQQQGNSLRIGPAQQYDEFLPTSSNTLIHSMVVSGFTAIALEMTRVEGISSQDFNECF